MPGAWHELEPRLGAELRDLLVGHQIRCRRLINAGRMLGAYRVRPLPFWAEWMWIDALIEPHDAAGTLATAAFLYGPYGAMPLDGGSLIIHEVNDTGLLELGSDALACDYLRLFCSAVHGDEGPFHLIETPAAFAALTGADPLPEVVVASASSIRAGRLDDRWGLDAIVFYGDCLFEARFVLSPDGIVEMTGDNPLAAVLPRAAFQWDDLVCRPVNGEESP